jgi:hypothetical protein
MPPSPKKEDPPLDDPRWRPLVAVHHRLAEHLGYADLAAFELTLALANGKLHGKWQSVVAFGYDLVPLSFWREQQVSSGPQGARVVLRPSHDDADLKVVRSSALISRLAKFPAPALLKLSSKEEAMRNKRLSETVFFVWGPDLGEVWPSFEDAQKPAPKAVTEIDERRKPGRRVTKRWKLQAAGELYRIVIVEGKPPPTADTLATYCQKKTGYLPDESHVQKLIKSLL